ncbi:hypothetical protein SERN_0825 [Serinibacter arcticus]|uniref:Uncharacterized protein n=1 Tax=Serinibacter arcticus TaxID=1655435 RepID=A0A4Z1E7X9_9MICO|nr:hypothetical protein SERN_0825 [Serinibacter arcticus]
MFQMIVVVSVPVGSGDPGVPVVPVVSVPSVVDGSVVSV